MAGGGTQSGRETPATWGEAGRHAMHADHAQRRRCWPLLSKLGGVRRGYRDLEMGPAVNYVTARPLEHSQTRGGAAARDR
jgi:hypothetical protein